MSSEHSSTPVEYRTIERFKGYRFGSDGSIQSCWAGSGPGSYLSDAWKPLKLVMTRIGYLVVTMKHDGKYRCTHVSHLICEAFHGPRSPGMEVCHNNGNPSDNRPHNLRYDTRQGNEDDKRRHGTRPRGVGTGTAKLDESKVRMIREMYGRGDRSKISIARQFGIHHSTVIDILDRKTWTHVV